MCGDVHSQKTRSFNMSRIRGKDTLPEVRLRSALHRAGFRFRLHVKRLPGKPDIVLPKYRTVIMVHGCFWHRHEGCRYATTPSTNATFWAEKFAYTVNHDHMVEQALEAQGWRVLIVWECELRTSVDGVVQRIADQLTTGYI